MKETFLTIQPPLRLVFIVAFLVWLFLSVYKFAMCKTIDFKVCSFDVWLQYPIITKYAKFFKALVSNVTRRESKI
jgi:hypothetical protein